MVNDVHPYQITALKVLNIHARKNFEIPIAGSEGLRHLVILGRNGAGKTTLLSALQEWCAGLWGLGKVIPIFSDLSRNWYAKGENFLFAYFPANRKFSAEPVAGPTKTPLVIETMGQPGPLMMQHMVNQRFEELLAKDEGKTQEAERIYQWFGRVEKAFQKLTNISTMKLSFERSNGS